MQAARSHDSLGRTGSRLANSGLLSRYAQGSYWFLLPRSQILARSWHGKPGLWPKAPGFRETKPSSESFLQGGLCQCAGLVYSFPRQVSGRVSPAKLLDTETQCFHAVNSSSRASPHPSAAHFASAQLLDAQQCAHATTALQEALACLLSLSGVLGTLSLSPSLSPCLLACLLARRLGSEVTLTSPSLTRYGPVRSLSPSLSLLPPGHRAPRC